MRAGGAAPVARVGYEKVRFLTDRPRPLLRLVAPVLLVGLWELVCRLGLVSPFVLPAPSSVLARGIGLWADGSLPRDLFASLGRLGLGFGLGALAGLAVGLMIGFSRVLEGLLDPVVVALLPIPKIALLPLLIVWLGLGESPKVAVLALGVFFPVALNTVTGVRGADPLLVKVAVSFGATRGGLVRDVILPGALPAIFTGLRLGAGTALLLVVSAELVGADSGLGFLVLQAGNLAQTDKLFVGLVALSLLGVLVNALFLWLERRLTPWR